MNNLFAFGILYPFGLGISLIGSQLQCSKIGLGTSAIQAFFWALYPTLTLAVLVHFPVLLAPFQTTLEGFGVMSHSRELAIGYVMMIISWIGTVWNIHQTEKEVCVATVDEMNAFKKKMLEELKEKDEDTETRKPIRT